MKTALLSRAFIKTHPLAAYALVWLLSLFIVALEIIGSGVSGSQALLADVGHVASDTVIALVPLAALLFVRAGWSYRHVATVSSYVAAALLLFVGWHVGSEAWAALTGAEEHAHEVNGWLLLAFSLVSAGLNLLQHRFLSRIDPEHHHGAHKGLHFHVLMDLMKNIMLPLLGVGIALSILPHEADLWTALIIGILLGIRALLLVYATVFPGKHAHHEGHHHA